jgi:hypothetical protein
MSVIMSVHALIAAHGELGYLEDPHWDNRPWNPKGKPDRHFEDVRDRVIVGVGNTTDDFVVPLHRLTMRNQLARPSCVGFGLRALIQQQLPFDEEVSPMGIWYNARKTHNSADIPTGTYISGGLYALDHDGFSWEKDWSYSMDLERATTRPDVGAMMDADDNQLDDFEYRRVASVEDVERVIRMGVGVVNGMSVGDAFADAPHDEDGVLTDPGRNLGGHCTTLFGVRYRHRNGVLVREFADFNSWDVGWGHGLTDCNGFRIPGGCLWLHEDIVATRMTDMWMATLGTNRFYAH